MPEHIYWDCVGDKPTFARDTLGGYLYRGSEKDDEDSDHTATGTKFGDWLAAHEDVEDRDDFDERVEEASRDESARELWRCLAVGMERIAGMAPEKVIFSGPATIAIWPSGDKVVAKCSGNDEYDREKGLMMCLLKKAYGSKAVDILEEWV